MPTKDSRVHSVRILDRDWERLGRYLEREGKSFNGYVKECIDKIGVHASERGYKVEDARHIRNGYSKLSEDEEKDFNRMMRLSGVTFDKLVRYVYIAWGNGEIEVGEEGINVYEDELQARLRNAIDRSGLDYEKMMGLCIKSVEGYTT